MRIIIATTNENKYEELAAVLKEFGIATERRGIECNEHGKTLEEIAKGKAREAFRAVGKSLIAEDTGIFFSAYENFPGTRAKRAFQELGIEGILKKLEGKNRDATFRTAICYTDGKKERVFTGEMKGIISERPEGKARMSVPYERIFIPDGKNVQLSFMSRGEKNRASHRAQAARKFGEWFRNERSR